MHAAAAAAKSLQLSDSVSDSVRPHRRQPTRLPCPWDSPGKNAGAGCHFLLQCMKVKSESEVAQSFPTLSNPMDCSPPVFSVHGIFQAQMILKTIKHQIIMVAHEDRDEKVVTSIGHQGFTEIKQFFYTTSSSKCMSYNKGKHTVYVRGHEIFRDRWCCYYFIYKKSKSPEKQSDMRNVKQLMKNRTGILTQVS